MKFLHPEMLWALSALSIPVIVHLFNFRKFKRVYFPNVEFLKEIKQETQNKSKLRHLLILFARMLALTCIILAFAQPYIPNPGMTSNPGVNAVSIYIDNSFSMEGQGKDGRMLDIAKNKALEIVQSFAPSDKFQLLTSDFEGRHQRLVSRDEMTELIQEVEISSATRHLSDVYARQKDLLTHSGLENRRAFILSDLQKTVTDVSRVQNDSSILMTVLPDSPGDLANLYIDSVWFDSPVRQINQPETLHARIRNTGSDGRENLPVQLLVNGQQKSVASATVPAESFVDLSIAYTNTEPGFKHAVLQVDDQNVTKDDAFYFSYTVAEKIRVLDIRGENAASEAVATVFQDDPYFAYTPGSEKAIDFGAFVSNDLIILDQLRQISSGLISEVDKFLESGGSVLLIPGDEIVMNEYNALLAKWNMGQIAGKMQGESRVNNVNYDHYIFRQAFEKTEGSVDLPQVKSWYQMNLATRSAAEPMLMLENGNPFMVSAKVGRGHVYFSAVSLNTEASNFIRHAFFPASLLRIAEFSQPMGRLYYSLGGEEVVEVRNFSMANEETFRLRNVQGGQEFIPDHRNAGGSVEIYIHGDMNQAGNYELSSGGKVMEAVSFNYNRAESDNRAFSLDEFRAQLDERGWPNWSVQEGEAESIAAGADELREGKKYWLSMIVWALIFLAIEILLIKFWR